MEVTYLQKTNTLPLPKKYQQCRKLIAQKFRIPEYVDWKINYIDEDGEQIRDLDDIGYYLMHEQFEKSRQIVKIQITSDTQSQSVSEIKPKQQSQPDSDIQYSYGDGSGHKNSDEEQEEKDEEDSEESKQDEKIEQAGRIIIKQERQEIRNSLKNEYVQAGSQKQHEQSNMNQSSRDEKVSEEVLQRNPQQKSQERSIEKNDKCQQINVSTKSNLHRQEKTIQYLEQKEGFIVEKSKETQSLLKNQIICSFCREYNKYLQSLCAFHDIRACEDCQQRWTIVSKKRRVGSRIATPLPGRKIGLKPCSLCGKAEGLSKLIPFDLTICANCDWKWQFVPLRRHVLEHEKEIE